jgi:hypothetical protein
VIDSLSLKCRPSVSRISVRGGPQVAPPSVDFDTRIADVSCWSETDSEIW